MEFDPAIVLFGAVILLLAAILIGVIVAATWPWSQSNSEQRIQDRDDFAGRVAAMGREIATFTAEIGHLYEEIERLQDERDHLLAVLLRLAELLEQFPRTSPPK
jgi:hypothetical protein